MMAIVLVLFGAFNCAAAFTPYMQHLAMHERSMTGMIFLFSPVSAVSLMAAGLILLAMFYNVSARPWLSVPISIVGTLVLLYGILSVVYLARSPFSWMMAILGLAIFITTVCLAFDLLRRQEP